MTLPQLKEMSDYWTRNPPVHEMIAAYLGIGKKKATELALQAGEAVPDFLRDFVAAGGQVPGDLESPSEGVKQDG